VARRLKMRGRVLVRRGIAAAHMTTAKAQAQVEPFRAYPEAVLATIGAGWDVGGGLEVFAGRCVGHVKRAMSASAAQVRKWVAPQTGSVPAMKLLSWNPKTSIVIPQGESFTPISTARSSSSLIDATP